MHEPNEDVAGYIAARVLGEDSETPPQQPLHAMSLRLPYEMAAYLIELAGTTDTSRVEMARQLVQAGIDSCLLYTSPSPRDRTRSRMPSSA